MFWFSRRLRGSQKTLSMFARHHGHVCAQQRLDRAEKHEIRHLDTLAPAVATDVSPTGCGGG